MKTGEDLVNSVYDRIFTLSLRFLGDPDSAKDATQEICILLLTKFETFRGEAAFSTWALTVAANYLRSARKSALENTGISFEIYEADCAATRTAPYKGTEVERAILAEELKHCCSIGMLQCLDRTDRLIYVLHAFFGVSSQDGAEITGQTSVAYRKRLSRIRKKMASFLERTCGIYGKKSNCHCYDRVPYALQQKRITKEQRFFTDAMETLDANTNVFRTNQLYRLPAREDEIRRILSSVAGSLDLQSPARHINEADSNAKRTRVLTREEPT